MQMMKTLLEKNVYFVTFDVASQLQTFFSSNNDVYASLKSPSALVSENADNMRDLYGGSMYKAFASSLDYSKEAKYISFTICIDGCPL